MYITFSLTYARMQVDINCKTKGSEASQRYSSVHTHTYTHTHTHTHTQTHARAHTHTHTHTQDSA